MQRFNKTTQKLTRFVFIVTLLSTTQVSSDDLDSAQSVDNELIKVDVISTAKSCFAQAKERGTVWLKTQQAMERLLTLEKGNSSNQAAQLAQQILRDCRLINNQHRLEQARYLLSTMESKGFDDSALDAIRAQLMAADGEASLALAKDLWRELERNANSSPD